ncbi:hypothetical protein HYV88_00680 [Candidatus Woesearchaeota archaeon]|nr:hypothetical protein [Candidatus Woesearchaeota archaeon]
MKLTNPLTTEERIQIPRLIDHDILSAQTDIIIHLKNPEGFESYCSREKALALANFTKSVTRVVSWITYPRDICTDKENIKKVLDKFKILSDNKLQIPDVDISKQLVSYFPLLETVIFNLYKNARNASRDNPISLEVSQSPFPENALYIPEGARDHKDFTIFALHSSGRAFPENPSLIERLTICPPLGHHGFGLYFTGLAAKVLRAPVHIQSAPDNTTISFYHPIYPDDGSK